MLRCGCLKVRKNPLRFHPRSPNFQWFRISKCFANYYPASRGPSVFPSYLGRWKGLCSQGTCKLAKHLTRMGVEPCELGLWGSWGAEMFGIFYWCASAILSIFPSYIYIDLVKLKILVTEKATSKCSFFPCMHGHVLNMDPQSMDYPCGPSPWTPLWTQSMDYPCGPPYSLKMNFTSWPEYDMNNNVGQGGYYPPKANFALSLYYQAYELLILYTRSVFSWIPYMDSV